MADILIIIVLPFPLYALRAKWKQAACSVIQANLSDMQANQGEMQSNQSDIHTLSLQLVNTGDVYLNNSIALMQYFRISSHRMLKAQVC